MRPVGPIKTKGTIMSEAPSVALIARPTGVDLQAPQTNSALELASSLAGLNPALGDALQGYAKVEQEKLASKAKADALANSGQAFADAVREGKVQPTQNPWYIRAYVENAAQVRAQAQGAQLVADSQSWAERNDPAAFAQRWQTEVGKLAQPYAANPFEMRGFETAVEPLSQQALNSNVNYNAARIQQEHVQDVTTLSSQALQDALKADPQATPDQLFDAIETQHQKWLAVGGTEPQWRLLAKQAFVGAAANTNNPDLLDALKAPYRGAAPIASQADESGKPVGLELDSDKYWIERASEAAGMAAITKERNQIAIEGNAALKTATDQFGAALYAGKVDPQQIQDFLISKGVSPRGAAYAIGQVQEDVSRFESLNRASLDIHSTDPTKANDILSLWSEGSSKGWSPSYEDRVSQAVLNHQIGLPDAEQMILRARETSRQTQAENRAEAHAARADANSARSLRLQETRDIQDWVKGSGDTSGAALASATGDKSLLGNTPTRIATERAASGAATEAYRKTGSVEAAKQAADQVYAAFLSGRIARYRQARQPSASGDNPTNPLRTR